jgi:nitrile hydratase
MAELTLEKLVRLIERGGTTRRPADGMAPRFKAGDRVRTRNDHPPHHTRLPRYAMGRCGEVVMVHGVFVFPDSNARHQGEQPQHLYAVRFEGSELWGGSGHARDRVILDLFESYLEPA